MGLYFRADWPTILDLQLCNKSPVRYAGHDGLLFLFLGNGHLQLLDKKINMQLDLIQNKKTKVDVWALLRSKYPASEYCLMEEVSDAAGHSRSRSADFVVYNLWPSRGLAIIGIELKRSRSDWLSELKKPDKAENIFKYCDYFYLLTTDETIAKMEEIPPAWGWICVKGSCIKILKEAPKQTPIPVSRHFVAAMLKRAADKEKFVHVDSIEDRIEAAREQGMQQAHGNSKYDKEKLIELQKIQRDFEEASGLRFGSWGHYDPKLLGAALKLIANGEAKKIEEQLLGMQKTAETVLSRISESLQTFSALKK
jgi:hypothetical protein